MKKNIVSKLICGTLACLTVVSIGNYCYHTHANNNYSDINNEEPIIYTEVSSYDTLYNFSKSEVLAEHSDLVVVGKVTSLETPINYNPTTKKYGKTRTPGSLEVIEVIKNVNDEEINEVEFLDIGGTLSYSEYEKSLLPAQKAKREYLMNQSGISKTKNNIFVKQSVKNQLEIEEGKTYIMYLKYDSNFGKYAVINQPYGVKEYNPNSGKVLNHVTNTVETLEELM